MIEDIEWKKVKVKSKPYFYPLFLCRLKMISHVLWWVIEHSISCSILVLHSTSINMVLGFAVTIDLFRSFWNKIVFFLQPVNPSHHVIDAVFIPDKKTNWYLLYTEQRNGHGYIWRQKFNQIFQPNHRLQNNAHSGWDTNRVLIINDFFVLAV